MHGPRDFNFRPQIHVNKTTTKTGYILFVEVSLEKLCQFCEVNIFKVENHSRGLARVNGRFMCIYTGMQMRKSQSFHEIMGSSPEN